MERYRSRPGQPGADTGILSVAGSRSKGPWFEEMKAFNLYFLTRDQNPDSISSLYQALSGRKSYKPISPHEAASLCMLTDLLADGMKKPCFPVSDWLPVLDGFFFSYVIEHIGKEFDLLKFSADGEYALNIELKSEEIGEERIKKQLEQNRYYLSHAVNRICSYTFVMSTGTIYCLNDKNYFHECPPEELVHVLCRPVFQNYLSEGIDRYFRSSDYLISPVAAPEKYLQGQYFLTNQQYSFRQTILEHLKTQIAPVISITGSAGTGKTLLLYDLARALSRKDHVRLVHSGQLRQGHFTISDRLRNVEIVQASPGDSLTELSGCSFLLIDEADYLSKEVLMQYLEQAGRRGIPAIAAYDPHQLLREHFPEKQASETVEYLASSSTLSLAFTGHIRINRPVYSFLRTLLNLHDHSGSPDYSCIDVLYADTRRERELLVEYYTQRGYLLIDSRAGEGSEDRVIAQEYCKVMMVLGPGCSYDESLHLCAAPGDHETIRLLYEGLSRTRENLCLVIEGNPELFDQILAIRLHRNRS